MLSVGRRGSETVAISNRTAIELGLKPYAEFVRGISPMLARIPPRKRKSLLDDIYELATQKVEMEGLKRGVEDQGVEHRRRRIGLARTRAHIKTAKKELLDAQSSYAGQGEDLGIVQVIARLDEMNRDLEIGERIHASIVHPARKTGIEKRLRPPEDTLLDYASLFPGMNKTAIDYWFISGVESRLREFAADAKIYFLPSEYDRIISKAFEAAFGERTTIDRVKTARKRLAKRAASVPAPVQGQQD